MIGATAVQPRSMTAWAVGGGVALGLAYTLSPLTVMALAVLPLAWTWVSKDLSDRERRWLGLVLTVAVAVRLLAIGGLFLSASPSIPYANFFGDEELFKRRSVWIRNIGLGVPISGADMIYAFDDVGRSLHLYVLAYLQAIVGNAPYGIPVLDATVYMVGVLIMYRTVRPVFGGAAALAGLTLLLFLPSLFSWSISALKEPSYMCVAVLGVVAAAGAARADAWGARLGAFVAVAVCAVVLNGLRDGGMATAVMGVFGGLALAAVLTRPRLLLVLLVVAPLVTAVAFRSSSVQLKVLDAVRQAAGRHWGQIYTPGYTYKLLDSRLYPDRSNLESMTPPEAARFVIRAVGSYLTVPLPWRIESRAALAFLPELMVWYGLVLLAPIGIVVGLRRDAVLTCLLVSHATVAALIVALTGGNVGTLVRHRGLALPFLVWLSMLGAVEVTRTLLRRAEASRGLLAARTTGKGE